MMIANAGIVRVQPPILAVKPTALHAPEQPKAEGSSAAAEGVYGLCRSKFQILGTLHLRNQPLAGDGIDVDVGYSARPCKRHPFG